eukprot:scaffold36436_cov176-Amphora_coffeaeformis.AAC.11
MPISPYSRRNLNDDDDDQSESGIASESGIYTFDGNYTIASRSQIMRESDRVGQELDDTLDHGSLISGIEDSSFLMNESLYRAKLRDEDSHVRSDYSLDQSSMDLGDYTKMPYPNGDSTNVDDSTAAVMRTTNPTTTAEDSIFSGSYSRVIKSFLFPSQTKQNIEGQDEETGKSTPKTLSPKDSTDDVQRFHDDDASQDSDSVIQGRPAKTIILGKAPPRTPKQRLEDYKKQVAETPRTVQGSTMTIYSETKILGLRLSRLVCIILLILVAAVAVAVGSALALQDNDSSSTNRNSSTGNEQVPFQTDSPVDPVVQTLAPSTAIVNDTVVGTAAPMTVPTISPTRLPTPSPTRSPIIGTYAPSPPLPTGVPSFPMPTLTPTVPPPTGAPTVITETPTALPTTNPTTAPTVAPVNFCGEDDDVSTFVLFNENRNCAWFRGTNLNFQNFFCDPRYDAFWVCRATCNNCLDSPTASPTTAAPTAPTVQPTGAPTTLFRNIEQTVLLTAPSSTRSNLQGGNTPQQQALDFLLREEATIALFPAWRIQQLFAMATLGFAANLDGGGGQRWLNTYDECQYWGVACDDSGAVSQINISGRDRGGELPDEISMLSSLVFFDAALNGFSGTIPEGFGLLPNLITLRLEQNDLTGNLPQSFANASSIRNLFLNRNAFSGPFPSATLGEMTGLQVVSIFGNQFTGDITGTVCNLGLETFVTDCQNEGCYTRCIN